MATGLNQELRHRHKAPNVLTTSVHPLWVRTPLIEPYMSKLREAGSTTLEPHVVADAIAKQIFDCSGGQVYVPGHFARIASSLRAWPNWLQEVFRGDVGKMVLAGTE